MNLFDLLGQAPPVADSVRLPGENEPQLGIGWGDFRQSLASRLGVLFFGPSAPKDFLSQSFFRDAWIENKVPFSALIAAALWHVAFLLLPMPSIAPRRNPAFDNVQLTWSGPINDLPLVEIPVEKPKSRALDALKKAPPVQSADAYHPRQRIFTDPVHPNHPRQTLVNPAAPQIAPKLLPNLPNMVELAQTQAPARPKIEISKEMLRMLHPVERRAEIARTVAPTLPNAEQRPAEFSIAMQQNQPARPKLEINAGSTPRFEQQKRSESAGPAPEVGSVTSASNGAASTFIALSATPGPAAPVIERPKGNLAARVSISPEGEGHGTSAANASNGPAGTSPIGISISGGHPRASNATSGLSAVQPRLSLPSSHSLYSRPDPNLADDPPARTGPPNFAALGPGAKPEQIFGAKRVYTMNVNMPNLSSASGSWIINFSELGTNGVAPRFSSHDDVAAPVPIHKVDPKYPPTLIAENVEGDVILYAVIRSDGSVDSIQLVHGVDSRLDANAMDAFKQWKFRPAEKNGKPIDLEAIVHIPFRVPPPQY
jgi:TonB family protein